jgi:hypothetical protein
MTFQFQHLIYHSGQLSTLALFGLFAGALILSIALCFLVRAAFPRLSERLTQRTDRALSHEDHLRMRMLETFFSIASAIIQPIIVIAVLFGAYKMSGIHLAPVALIGASTFFVVIAGATIGPLLRDLTAGIIMVAEQWYHVGDHIAVEPFMNVSGVVERVTLRSTRLRSITGEIIWLHNQHIQGVRVTPRSVKTLVMDVFVTDLKRGEQIVQQTIKTLPKGPTMVAQELAIVETEQLSDELWRIMAVGQTVPGREWLIEDFAVKMVLQLDVNGKKPAVVVHGPIVHYTDPAAERRFKRSVRTKSNGPTK